MGLWQGILNYTGGDFSAHRDWWIRQYLHRAIFMQARSGDLGQKLRQGMEDYRDMDQKLLADLGRNPTLEEIAEAMHATVEETAVYADMLSMARTRQQVDAAMEEKEPEPEDEQAVEDILAKYGCTGSLGGVTLLAVAAAAVALTKKKE